MRHHAVRDADTRSDGIRHLAADRYTNADAKPAHSHAHGKSDARSAGNAELLASGELWQHQLTSGFVPDPFTQSITSGGQVDVSYLGGGCSGFATSAPDFSVNYTSGAFPTLRFYFIGSGDTTMIINAPNASYFCDDDSFGTLNPTIDFNSPSSGRYDIWIGSYQSGTFISGTLYVTEGRQSPVSQRCMS